MEPELTACTPAAGLAVSPDGRQVAVGTECGALGLLDVATQSYSTLLRAHTAAVYAAAPLPGPQQRYCTAAADGTARVWDAASGEQLLEFYAPGQSVLSVACHPTKPEVVCGFQSGALRVFDLGRTALAHGSQQHWGAVVALAFACQGRTLFSLGACSLPAARAAGRGPGAALLCRCAKLSAGSGDAPCPTHAALAQGLRAASACMPASAATCPCAACCLLRWTAQPAWQ